MSMKSVDLRELRNRLSELVRDVRSGEVVLVTDQGEVVAELVPPRANTRDRRTPAALTALVTSGQVTVGGANDASVYPKLPHLVDRDRAAEFLNAERGAR